MTVEKILVIGAGQMGSGIAQVAAQSKFQVFLMDNSEPAVQRAKAGIQKSLEKLHSKNKLNEKPEEILARIQFRSDKGFLASENIDLLIEAVVENFEVKAELFRELNKILPEKTVFASNTSSISITKLAAASGRPEQFVGMHFMNPVPMMKLVEVICGLQTSEETKEIVEACGKKMGKTLVHSKDIPGFIINRILMPMINEATFALSEGIASAEDIDLGMKLGTNQPMGPLELADFIGLDTCLYIMNVLHEGLGDSKYRASPLLKQYVDAGYLGRKSDRGFYSY